MKFKILITLCILQFSNCLFAGNKNDSSKKLFIGPRINKAEYNYNLKLNNQNLIYSAGKDYDIFNVDIDKETLKPISKPSYVKQKKKSDNEFIVDGKKFIYVEKIITANNVIYFFNAYEVKDKSNSLYYQLADINGRPNSNPIKIAINKDFEEAKSDLDYRNCSFTIGTNKKMSIIYIVNQASHKTINKNDKIYKPGEVEITYYNSKDMKELGSGTYDLGISKLGKSSIFGDDGMVYSLVENISKEETEVVDKKGKLSKVMKDIKAYKVLAINLKKPENPPLEKSLFIKDKKIFHVKLQLEENGNLFCAGTNEDLSDNNSTKRKGFFNCALNANNLEIYDINEFVFEEGLYKSTSPVEYADAIYQVIGIEKMQNGSTSYLFEETLTYLVTVSNSNGYSNSLRYYERGNLMVCNVGTSNKINWTSNIFKRGIRTSSDFKSLNYKRFGDKIKIIFNDSKDNYDRTNLMYKTNLKSNEIDETIKYERIALASIDEFGNSNRRLVANENFPYNVDFETSVWSEANNEFYFMVWNKFNKLYDPWLFCMIFPPVGIVSLIMDWQGKNQYYRIAKIKLD